ncbi:MAG: hypothetical protein A2Y02_01475 [Omnitrophica bacterium GWA2_52_12]|nr:MAG: hypothetical protein A2Y02_01475 [Omnitrophica bacterium GWA2_52_12]
MTLLKRRWFFVAVTALGALLLAWLAGEALVFVTCGKQISMFPRYVAPAQYGEFSIRRNEPLSRYRHKSYDGAWEFRINRRGFRDDRDFPYDKTPGVKRILVLGDSFTAGYEVSQADSFSAQLEGILRGKGLNVEVINSGVSGFSTAEELVFLEQEGLKYQPDAVVLAYFTNDPEDNVRAGIYGLNDGQLTVLRKDYLPYVDLRGFLEKIPPYRWLGENSYLHNYLNSALTLYAKELLRRKNAGQMTGQAADQKAQDIEAYQNDLTRMLLQKIAEVCRRNRLYFVLMDIPVMLLDQPVPEMIPSLPRDPRFHAVADATLEMLPVLQPYHERGETLYRPHGKRHWTELSHRLAAEKLADLLSEKL